MKEGKTDQHPEEELEDSEIPESRKRKIHKAYKSTMKKCIRAMEPSFDNWVIVRRHFK